MFGADGRHFGRLGNRTTRGYAAAIELEMLTRW